MFRPKAVASRKGKSKILAVCTFFGAHFCPNFCEHMCTFFYAHAVWIACNAPLPRYIQAVAWGLRIWSNLPQNLRHWCCFLKVFFWDFLQVFDMRIGSKDRKMKRWAFSWVTAPPLVEVTCSNAFLLPALQSLLGHFVFCLACGTGANSCNATLKTKRSYLFRRQCWRSVQLSYQETIKSLRSGGNKQFEPLGWLCIFPSFESAKVYFVDIMKLNCPAAKWAKSNLLMQTRNSCIEARAALACSKVWIGWNASKDPRMSILRLQGDEVCN